MVLLIRMMKPISSMMGGAAARADLLDPLANFIRELEHLSSLSGPDISARWPELPVPQDSDVEGMWVDDALNVACLYSRIYVRYCC